MIDPLTGQGISPDKNVIRNGQIGDVFKKPGDPSPTISVPDTEESWEDDSESNRAKRPRVQVQGDTRIVDYAQTSSTISSESPGTLSSGTLNSGTLSSGTLSSSTLSSGTFSSDSSGGSNFLGVSWRQFDTDPDVLACLRGWSNFIKNNYSLTGIRIMMKTTTTDSILVESNEGWYLFQEDLLGAKLVSRDYHEMANRIRADPIQFEPGEPELRAPLQLQNPPTIEDRREPDDDPHSAMSPESGESMDIALSSGSPDDALPSNGSMDIDD